MTFKQKVYSVLAAVLLVIGSLTAVAAAGETKAVVLLPFEAHASDDGNVLRASLYNHLAAELRKEKNIMLQEPGEFSRTDTVAGVDLAMDAGRALGADYVITGSVTRLGNAVSIDAKIMDVGRGEFLSPVSVQGSQTQGVEALARHLKTALLSRADLLDVIARIDIAGNRKISPSAITERIRSKPGLPLSDSDIADDIKTIYKMGFFLDVSASVTSEPAGKVITFSVSEKGLISDIRLVGNKKLDRDDIVEVMSVKTRQSLNREKIKEDIQKIKALYDTKGYYNAQITDRIERDGEKDFVLILDIQENDRIYIRRIAFEGNEVYTTKELVNMMSTTERTLLGFITDTGILKREELRQDVQKISAFYFNNGFINSQIGEPVITHDAKGIYIHITVREGKRFKVGNVVISGDQLEKPRADLLRALKTKAGSHYDREAVIKDIEMITLAANDEGYAHADVNPRVTTHEKEQLVDLDLQLTKGALVYIARVGISGNTVTRDKVIRRQISVVEGELYSATKLKNSYMSLNALRYFEEVDFQTEKAEEGRMNVNIRVKEKNTGMFMIGAGYSAVDQAVIMAQIVQQNFLGYGQTVSLKASLGSKTNQYELSFTEPWLFDLPLWCKADIWKYKKEYDSYTIDTRGAGVTLGYPVWKKIVGYVGYKLSMDDIQDVNYDTASQYIINQAGERVTSALSFTLAYDSTDDNIFPSRGIKTSATVQHAGDPLGGNAKFTKYGAVLTGYYPVFRDIVIGAKGRIGYLQNNDDSDERLPIYERYVLGGINSLRGLRYVGPTNPATGDVIGGTTMLTLTAEIVFPLIKDAGMKGVLFYDAGNAWNGAYYLGDLRQTCGAGIRWYSPIGPLRLEYGYVLDRRGLNDDSMGRWEFTIGMFM